MTRIGIGLVLGAVLVACGDNLEEVPTVRTIRVVEHADTDVTTDNEPDGDSVGDILTFSNMLFDESNTRQVGTNQGYCVRVVVGQSYECFWTAFFEDTKDFNGARGQMQLEFRDPQGKEFDFIYQVLLDR